MVENYKEIQASAAGGTITKSLWSACAPPGARVDQGISVDPDPHEIVVNEFDGWGPGPLAPTDSY